MKKTLFVLVGLLGIAAPAKAQPLIATQAVRVIVSYSASCSSVTIGVTPTEVTGNTTVSSTTAGIHSIAVLNFSTANTVYCSDNSAVTSSGNNIGWPIAYTPVTGPRAWMSWAIHALHPWYCISSAANTSIMVCKDR